MEVRRRYVGGYDVIVGGELIMYSHVKKDMVSKSYIGALFHISSTHIELLCVCGRISHVAFPPTTGFMVEICRPGTSYFSSLSSFSSHQTTGTTVDLPLSMVIQNLGI